MDPPRLLYSAFDPIPSPKGASTHTLQFLARLRHVFRPELLCLGGPGLAQAGEVMGVPVRRVQGPVGNLIARAMAFAEQALVLVERRQPAVVHFRTPWDGFPLAWYRRARRPGLKLVFEANGLPSIELAHHHADLPPGLLAKLRAQEDFVLREADAIICPSTVTAGYLAARGAPPGRIAVVPNGVDLDLFRPGPAPAADLPQITYVGTLSPWQGLADLLRACALLARPFQLRVIGGGPRRLRRELAVLGQRLGLGGRLRLEEACPPELVPEALREAAVCVAPLDASDRNVLQGCCPLKILEYMACGRPVVAADLPVVCELAPGEEALLYPPGDAAALAAALDRVLGDPGLAAALGRNGRARAERYSWTRAGDSLLAVYRGLGFAAAGDQSAS